MGETTTPNPEQGGVDTFVAALLADALRHAPVGVAVLDRTGRYRWLNEGAAERSGLSAPDAVGHRPEEVLPEIGALVQALVAEVTATGRALLDVELGTATDGRSFLESFVPLFDARGEVAGAANFSWEITDRVVAEAQRRELEARFHTMADAAPVLIWTADESGECDWFNATWLAYTGRRLADEVGDGWVAGVHPDDVERCTGTYRTALADRAPFEVEYRLRRHDGEHRWILDRAVPRFQPDGTFVGFIGSCIDIEDRKAAEAERARLLVAERDARAAAERAAERLRRLQAVTAAFAEALTPDRVAEVLVAQAVSATGAEAGAMCLVERGLVHVRCAVGYADEVLQRFEAFGIDAGLPIATAIRTGAPVYIGSLDELGDDYGVFRELSTRSGRRSAAALPLVMGGSAIGAVSLSFSTSQPFDHDQRSFLEAVTSQCAAALERARLLEDTQRAQMRLAFLADVGESVGSTLDRTEILRRATSLAVPHLADWAAAHLPDGDQLQVVTVAHTDPRRAHRVEELLRRHPAPVDSSRPVSLAFRTGRPQRIPVVTEELLDQLAPEVRAATADIGAHSGIAVPITSRGEPLGVLSFALADPSRTHTDADVTVAAQMGSRVGIALENAGLYEREHWVSEELQRAVLPERLPHTPGLELAARYLPASPGVEVGGDWYDAFRLPDGRLGLAVGDVSGHGLQAAATMGQLRNALRAYAFDGDDPGTVVARLNELLVQDEREHFATAVYGLFDPATSRLRWVNAGHPPPLLVGDDTSFLDEPSGIVLGVVPDQVYDEGETVLGDRDLLLLYTDGLIEQPGEHLLDGMARLRSAMHDAATTAVDTVCDGAISRTLGERERTDDICVLALRPR